MITLLMYSHVNRENRETGLLGSATLGQRSGTV